VCITKSYPEFMLLFYQASTNKSTSTKRYHTRAEIFCIWVHQVPSNNKTALIPGVMLDILIHMAFNLLVPSGAYLPTPVFSESFFCSISNALCMWTKTTSFQNGSRRLLLSFWSTIYSILFSLKPSLFKSFQPVVSRNKLS
jgi:hypothetical protein